eukprot:TRINITY_DN49121_c0_g1_i1.p2 TRINITY_DN49121_c0_g1~~TRINITY_DN49121_c0_g1_i1.p2  ORF type:complete len:259 (-),score=103.25 TRINITY_DN49121_c0_g1_i1:636-1412(-)
MAAVNVAGLQVPANTGKEQRTPSKRMRGTPAASSAGDADMTADTDVKKSDGTKYKKNELTELVARLTLTQAKELAQVKAAVTYTVTFSKEAQLGKELMENVKATMITFTEQSKNGTPAKRLELGSPHVFAWLVLYENVLEVAKAKKYELQVQQLEEFGKFIKDRQTEVLKEGDIKDPDIALRRVVAAYVRSCRLSKCFNPALSKLEISVSNEVAVRAKDAVIYVLEKMAEGTLRMGQAPRTDLERRIQKLIEVKGKKE